MITPESARTTAGTAQHPTATHVETYGIEHIPESERYGKPRDMLFVWAGANVNFLSVVLGGSLVLLGLNLWQSLAVIVVGNLFWAFNGILAISGPVSGTPCSVLTRATYGIRGNRVGSLATNWSVCVAYAAVNLGLGSLAGFALLDYLGITVTTAVEAVVVAVLAGTTLLVSVYGHALILRLSPLFTATLTATLVFLAGFVVAYAEPGHVPEGAPHGADLGAALLIGFAIIASVPLSWGSGADYARYLPADASPRAVAWWTTLGGFVPTVLLSIVGVLAGTAVDMTDPQTSLKDIVPGWFYPLLLLAIVLGSVANNILTTYSSGLALQAVGVRISQWAAVLLDGLAATAITVYALFITDFLDALNEILELTVAVLGPGLAISVADVILRRNHYRGPGLHNQTPTSAYWYHGGINVAGLAAQLLGTGAALLCLNSLYVGPVASALNGADVSALLGPLVGGLTYTVLFRSLYSRQLDRVRQDRAVESARSTAAIA
ncbi:purine-cytosine permease family protein [Streptomyces atratus]|uniref:purine-cytosine permease family protein n=1 Tax=Streptomyces atratus TaxID=1893 RepID=UPI002255FA16|nr:cytosine permease [Streptomyces atratus]MCX5339750.1 cytosine permease [Streptomyces atratus]